MSLTKNIEEMEEQLKEEQVEQEGKEQDADDNDSEPLQDEEGGSELSDNDNDGEQSAGDDKEEPKKEQSSNDLTDAERARIRVLERQKREYQEQLKQAKEPKKEEQKTEAPNKEEDYEGWLEYQNEQLRKEVDGVKDALENNPVLKQVKAQQQEEAEMRGFQMLENQFKQSVDDYEDVSNHMAGVIYNSIRALNPGLPQDRAVEATKRQILDMANNLLDQGYENPVQVMYQMAKTQYGYQPKKEEKQEQKKPDLDKITEAKNKSATPAMGGRNKQAGISQEEFSKMSTAQKDKLSPDQIKELLDG